MDFPLPIQAVIIDLDGTMLDTALDLTEAANAMLRDFARPELDVATIRAYIGRGVQNLVKRCLAGQLGVADDPAPPPADALASFKRHYLESNGRYVTIYPGVVEGLRALHEMGLPMACVTNKGGDFAVPLLARSGLAGWFRLTVCGDTLARSKPDPLPLLHVCRQFACEPRRTLLIGDSLNDVTAARAAGCPVFCVPYGYNEGVDVRELDCDAIVPTLEAAARLVVAGKG